MKVLWFSLSPCNSIKRDNSTRIIQGWMISLENEIKKCNDIQLEVAYFTDKDESPFIFENVKYYPMNKNIFNQHCKVSRLMERYVSIAKKDQKATRTMLDIIKKSHPDIIHIHGTEESFGLIYEYIKNIPIVFSIQGLIAPLKEKFFSGIPQQQAYKYDFMLDRLKGFGIRKQYKSFCYRAEREKCYLSHAQYIFGRTFWDKDCTLGLNPQRKYYIVNEILRPEFYTKQWKGFISKDKIKLVSTISGGIYKGFETLLKTASLLKRHSNLNFEWHIAGYRPDSKWVKISEKTTQIYSKECNIVFHGGLDATELSNLLCNSDIYVQVSHIENSPNSVCEAMLLGMPIIASYAGGTATILKHEEEGILYQDGDSYVLSGAIIEMINNPVAAKQYAKNAHNKAIIRHDKIQIKNNIIHYYEQIINDYKISHSL